VLRQKVGFSFFYATFATEISSQQQRLLTKLSQVKI